VSLGAEWRRGLKELGPLLLFNPLWEGVRGNRYHIAKRNKILFSLSHPLHFYPVRKQNNCIL
jgi:hypothetical protein